MRSLVLSDHTAHQVQKASDRREAEFHAAAQAHEQALRLRRQRRQAAWFRFQALWRERQLWPAFKTALQLIPLFLQAGPRRPARQDAGHEEKMWAVGNEAERQVVKHLAKQFGQDWVLVSGYWNRKGEIDQILVGPGGLFAMEVKYVKGTVHCDGDHWWRDKYDRYGNLVERDLPIADKGGRAPSRQLNDAVDLLAEFLQRQDLAPKIHRTVVLAHRSSKLGKLKNLTIDGVVTLDGWKPRRAWSRSKALDPGAVERVVQAIQQDHEFHQQRRRKR